MTARTCQSCKHYEPSAVWRRGWCRNPRLYAPQQSHLVDQDALDCNRGLGSAWEAAEADAGVPLGRAERAGWQPLRLFASQPQLAPAGIAMMASSNVGGGSGSGGSGGSFSGPPRPDRPGSPAGQERTVSYQPEERYWTDYLRIALPVAGLLILLGVFWYWAGELIGGGTDDGSAATEIAFGEVVVASPTAPVASATADTVTVVSGPPPTPSPTTPASAAPTATTRSAVEQAPEEEPTESAAPAGAADPPEDQEYPTYPEGTAVETTEEVNLREGPSTESDPIEQLPAGSELVITGSFEEGGDYDWWPVRTASGMEGFVREDLLRAQD